MQDPVEVEAKTKLQGLTRLKTLSVFKTTSTYDMVKENPKKTLCYPKGSPGGNP